MRIRLAIIGLTCLSSLASAHASNMAIDCEYKLLKQAHETLRFCGESIDSVRQARYQHLVRDYLSFIAENKTRNMMHDESVEDIRRSLEGMGHDRVCNDPVLWGVFYFSVSDSGMAEARKKLSRRRDPSEGDCF